MAKRKTRILIGKIGLDGHDRGAKVVARALRDAGFEVIYTGIRQQIDDIVRAVVQEDVAVVGLSFLSGDHMTLVPRVIAGLQAAGRPDVPMIVGGIILPHQVDALMEMGVQQIFFPGTPLAQIIESVRNIVASTGGE
jgi:methylmalonyl-CoA mutase C-terminal domain/subunit